MISIIIPVLNEEKKIAENLSRLYGLSGDYEIIIVDGGSTDKTLHLVKDERVITSKKGRGNQQNAGAMAARGEILFFLHIDSRLDDGALKSIQDEIDKNTVAGFLKLYFYDYDSLILRSIAHLSNLRAKLFGIVFGDQGLFIKKDEFFKLGGFKDIPIMEDFEFSRRLRKRHRPVQINERIGTSARRFIEGGTLRTILKMHLLKIKYLLGMDPTKIQEEYRDIR